MTANAFSLPGLICGSTVGVLKKPIATSPLTTARTAAGGALLEDHARQVQARADAARAVGELARLGLRLGDQVGDAVRRIIGRHDQHVGQLTGT